MLTLRHMYALCTIQELKSAVLCPLLQNVKSYGIYVRTVRTSMINTGMFSNQETILMGQVTYIRVTIMNKLTF